MPFQSEKQRRLMWAKHPAIARRWAAKYGNEPVKEKTGKKYKKGAKLNTKQVLDLRETTAEGRRNQLFMTGGRRKSEVPIGLNDYYKHHKPKRKR